MIMIKSCVLVKVVEMLYGDSMVRYNMTKLKNWEC
jgi:hypothetical protein